MKIANMIAGATAGLVGCSLLVGWLAVRREPKVASGLPPARTVATERKSDLDGSSTRIAIGDMLPSDFGALASASIDTRSADADAQTQAALLAESAAVLSAYAETNPQAMLELWSQTGVVPPETWSDPTWAQTRWEASTAPIRAVTFDLSKTMMRRVELGTEPSAPSGEAAQRACGRRDSARPFLQELLQRGTDVVNRTPAYEVVINGTVPTPDEENQEQTSGRGVTFVSVGITFVRNPHNGRWIVVRTCLYNFPRTANAAAPVL